MTEFEDNSKEDLLSETQWLQVEKYKIKKLANCDKCNHGGYLEGDKMCICLRKVMRRYRLLCSNIPKQYQDVSFDLFKARNDIGFKQVVSYSTKLENARKKGIGLHIYSKKPGTGKTMLASCVLLEAIKKGYFVWFTSLEELIEDVKLGFNDERQRKKMEWVMFRCDFLMLDEISKIQGTQWKDSKINDLIQRRVNERLPIISTDNLGIDQLQNKFPEHLISRFSGTQIEIQLSHNVEYRRDVQKKNLLKELMR
jgi:DNA replication protein DnaC